MSTAATPSTSAWCIFASSATRSPPATPSTTVSSHSGRERSRRRDSSWPTSSASSSGPPGAGRATRRTCQPRSNWSSSIQTGFVTPGAATAGAGGSAGSGAGAGRRARAPRACAQAGAGLEHEHAADAHRHRSLLGGERGAIGGRKVARPSREGSRPTQRLHSHEGARVPTRAGRRRSRWRRRRLRPTSRSRSRTTRTARRRRRSTADDTATFSGNFSQPPAGVVRRQRRPTRARRRPSPSRTREPTRTTARSTSNTNNMRRLDHGRRPAPGERVLQRQPVATRGSARDLHLHRLCRPRRHADELEVGPRRRRRLRDDHAHRRGDHHLPDAREPSPSACTPSTTAARPRPPPSSP